MVAVIVSTMATVKDRETDGSEIENKYDSRWIAALGFIEPFFALEYRIWANLDWWVN
jgi:hypothetical protein